MSKPTPQSGPNSLLTDLPFAVALASAFAAPFLLQSKSATARTLKDTAKGVAWIVVSVAGAGGVVVVGVGMILAGEKLWDRLKATASRR